MSLKRFTPGRPDIRKSFYYGGHTFSFIRFPYNNTGAQLIRNRVPHMPVLWISMNKTGMLTICSN